MSSIDDRPGHDDVDEEEEGDEVDQDEEYPFVEGEVVHLRLDVVGGAVLLRPVQPVPVLQLRIEKGEEAQESHDADKDEDGEGKPGGRRRAPGTTEKKQKRIAPRAKKKKAKRLAMMCAL